MSAIDPGPGSSLHSTADGPRKEEWMPGDHQVITPMLVYDDAPAAVEFLCRAFGFEEQFRFDTPDGTIGHAELGFGGAKIALATT